MRFSFFTGGNMKKINMKKIQRGIASVLAGILIFSLSSVSCLAGAGEYVRNPDMITLRPGIEYGNFDVTGDGKADRLLLRTSQSGGFFGPDRCYLQIYINKTKVFDFSDPYYRGDTTSRFEVKLCTLNSEKVFFFIRTVSAEGFYNFCRLYECKNGRLELVADLKNIYEDLFHKRECMDVKAVGKNNIQFCWKGQLGAAGELEWLVNFVCAGSTLEMSGRTCQVISENVRSYWTASREFTVYQTCGLEKEWFHVEEGEKVKIISICNDSQRFYIKIEKENGMNGWVPCPNNETLYFEEASYL